MRALLVACVVAFASLAAGAVAAPKLPDLPESYLFTPAGKVTPLRANVAYQAGEFPVPIRVTPPAAGWSGAQWKSGDQYFRGGGPPNFGWVHLARGSARSIPRGLISIMTAYARTPSVAATVDGLRTRGRGATYEDSSPVTVAGFAGIQFDGQIVGAKNREHVGHVFIPFSAPSHAAKYYPDEYPVYRDVFRIDVLNVRGRTVVVVIENVGLPAQQFPEFLARADELLAGLRFPRGG